MATVTLRSGELDGDLPGVCVMCGDDADRDLELTLREGGDGRPGRKVTLELPYCDPCRRLRKRSPAGAHEPQVVRIDGPPLAVKLAGVADDFADALHDDRAADRLRPARPRRPASAVAVVLTVTVGVALGYLFVSGLTRPAQPNQGPVGRPFGGPPPWMANPPPDPPAPGRPWR